MRYFVLSICVAIAIVALSGCGTFETNTKLALNAPEFGSKPSQGDEVKYPDWFTKKEKDGALYAVATEYSKDFQFAVDKAMLSAKRELAANFSSHTSAMLKDYAAEVGELDSAVIREIDRTTKMVVSNVNLVGVQRVNYRVQYEKDGYRAFVRLRYATDDSNKLLLGEVKRNRQLNAKLQASKSFKELEASVNKIEGKTNE
jgi:hypothetical protein